MTDPTFTPMTEWSAERLDALPDGTVIEVAWTPVGRELLMKSGGHWYPPRSYGYLDPLASSTAIRVVSVSVDALLNPQPTTVALGRIDPTSGGALAVLRAAIAHATGEAS